MCRPACLFRGLLGLSAAWSLALQHVPPRGGHSRAGGHTGTGRGVPTGTLGLAILGKSFSLLRPVLPQRQNVLRAAQPQKASGPNPPAYQEEGPLLRPPAGPNPTSSLLELCGGRWTSPPASLMGFRSPWNQEVSGGKTGAREPKWLRAGHSTAGEEDHGSRFAHKGTEVRNLPGIAQCTRGRRGSGAGGPGGRCGDCLAALCPDRPLHGGRMRGRGRQEAGVDEGNTLSAVLCVCPPNGPLGSYLQPAHP